MRMAAKLLGILLTGLCAVSAGAEQAPPALDEIVVTAERAGPGMWHVHRGDANVWILGSISPLPRDITWRSKQVESVLESTSQVLVQKPIEISVPRILWMLIADRKFLMVGGGKKLKDVLPPDLHARFAAQRSKVGDACRNALDAGKGAVDVIGRIRQTWLENIEKYLRSAGTTIAVVNLDLLLERGGLLDQLRAKGYEIDAP